MGGASQSQADGDSQADYDQDAAKVYKRVNTSQAAFFSGERGVPSKVKGKLHKGTPFIRGNAEDKTKIKELGAQLEEGNQQIRLAELEKRSLQEQIIRLLDERADDLGLTEEEKKAQLSKLNIKPFQNSGQLGTTDGIDASQLGATDAGGHTN
jgi:hypothetical protein